MSYEHEKPVEHTKDIPNISTVEDIYRTALEKWGDLQVVVCMEEMAELIKELSKHLRGNGNKEHIAEEIADVSIMLEQMTMYFKVENSVNECAIRKINRLRERLG